MFYWGVLCWIYFYFRIYIKDIILEHFVESLIFILYILYKVGIK